MLKLFKHLHIVNKHRFIVFIHCCKCGIFWQGLTHDLSKYSITEFFESVKYYNGKTSPINLARRDKGYSKAWLHHKGRNKHHFEYWYDQYNKDQVVIPYKYAVESVCDRIAACKCYNKKEFTPNKVLEYWLNGDAKSEMINDKIKKFFTTVFSDYCIKPEKEILNKKYLKETYNNTVLY